MNSVHSFFPTPLPDLRFAVSTMSLPFVLVSPLSSVLVSFCSLYHLYWCPSVPSIICPGVPSVACVNCLGVLFVLSSVMMFQHFCYLSWCPLISLSYVLVSCRFSLPSVLVSPLVYYLSWCPVYVSWYPTGLSSVMVSLLFSLSSVLLSPLLSLLSPALVSPLFIVPLVLAFTCSVCCLPDFLSSVTVFRLFSISFVIVF